MFFAKDSFLIIVAENVFEVGVKLVNRFQSIISIFFNICCFFASNRILHNCFLSKSRLVKGILARHALAEAIYTIKS